MKKIFPVVVLLVLVLAIITSGHLLLGSKGNTLGASVGTVQDQICLNKIATGLCDILGIHKSLKIGLMTLTSTADNANQPIVKMSDQSSYSDTMDLTAGSSTVRLGFSSLAGGYINYFSAKGFGVPSIEGQNLDKWAYGQGWQAEIRDRMHNLRYNPASVGFTGYAIKPIPLGAGTPVQLIDTKNKSIVVKQSNVSLYQGEAKGYDYTQHEDLAADNYTDDHGNTDQDLLPETNLTQDDEIRSEFDYTGAYLNVSDSFGIPALQYDYAYAYMRSPKSILQFINPKMLDSYGAPLFIPGRSILDISPATPGKQTLQPTDLSQVLPTFSVRVYPETFTAVMWKQGTVWQSVASSPRGTDRVKVASCRLRPDAPGFASASGETVYTFKTDCDVDNSLIIMATSNNPKTAFGVGLYVPQEMKLNALQTWIVDKTTMKVIGREDRRVQSLLNSTGGFTNTRTVLSGLRSPVSLAAAGTPHAFEMLTQRAYVLFGTPEQIEKAAIRFRASAAFTKAAGE